MFCCCTRAAVDATSPDCSCTLTCFCAGSTELYPEWPLAALSHVDVDTQKAVANALFALGADGSTLQFTRPARIATFTPPLSYMTMRDVLYIQDWIIDEVCITSTRLYDTILCPPGSFRMSETAVAASCSSQGTSCPPGYDCVCTPCLPLPLQVYSVVIAPATAPANVTPCERLAVCTYTPQLVPLLITLTDNWRDARPELGLPPVSAVRFREFDAATNTGTWLNPVAAGDGTWTLELPTPVLGLMLLEVAVDGVVTEFSPLLVSIVPPICPGRGAFPDIAGSCGCASRYAAIGPNGDCEAVAAYSLVQVAAGSAAGAAALVLLIVAVVLVMRRRAEALWRIPHAAVSFLDPPEVLGRGTFGLVVKGKYRGTTVALKRSLPTAPRSSSRSSIAVPLRSGSSGADSYGGSHRGVHAGSGGMSAIHSNGTQLERASLDSQRASLENQRMHRSGFDMQPADVEAADLPTSPTRASSMERASKRSSQFDARPIAEGSAGKARQSVSSSLTGISASRTTSLTTGSVLPTFCAGACPMLDDMLGGLWHRRKAAALRADFIREMRLLVHLRHPHILTVLGAVLHESEPILVMEHMDRGSLHDLLHNETLPLDGEVVLQLLRDVVSGMEFLHSADPPILHNDLKAANVLVDSSWRAKVSDFGLSGKRRASRGPPGTPFWMAPELLRRKGQSSCATDVYSFGITMSEVFNRAEPYVEQQMSASDVLARIAAVPKPGGPKAMRPALGSSVPPAFADLMRRCWHPDPSARPTMAAIAAELRSAADQEGVGAATVTVALTAAKHRHASERKLLNAMFPPAVAAALAEGRRVEPQEFPCVTVFFSDVVGFTDLCAVMLPAKVMAMLDRLYQAFDLLTAKHGLYKVRKEQRMRAHRFSVAC